MRELETEEKISYSIDVFKAGDKTKNKLILRDFKDEMGKNIGVIVLKYTSLDGNSHEAIIGTLEPTPNRRERASEISDKIAKQLEENTKPDGEYKAYFELQKYIFEKQIPFEFTSEGMDIISYKGNQNIEIEKTVFPDINGKLQSIIPKEELEQNIAEKKNGIVSFVKQKREDAKWKEIREAILRSKSKEEVEKFLKGEEIAAIMQRTEIAEGDSREEVEQKTKCKSRIVAQYLENTLNQSRVPEKTQAARTTLLNLYMTLKEESLAEDANEIVKKVEKILDRRMQVDKGEQLERDFKDMEILESYSKFFNLLEDGRDLNARIFAVKIKGIDFDLMERLFEKFDPEDKELHTYLKCKRDEVQEIETANVELKDEDNYISVGKLHKFLLNASIRDKNRAEVEQIVSGIFEQYKSDVFQEYAEEISVYNNYASKHGRYVCSTEKEEEKNKYVSENRDDEGR